MVGQKLGIADGSHTLTLHRVALVPNREQGNGGVIENQQVALTELREGLVGSPLQSVIEVVTPSRGKPSRHGWVGGVSWNVHMDLAAPKPKLTVQAATVHGKPHVAKTVHTSSPESLQTGWNFIFPHRPQRHCRRAPL
jgi:hypothetical protein